MLGQLSGAVRRSASVKRERQTDADASRGRVENRENLEDSRAGFGRQAASVSGVQYCVTPVVPTRRTCRVPSLSFGAGRSFAEAKLNEGQRTEGGPADLFRCVPLPSAVHAGGVCLTLVAPPMASLSSFVPRVGGLLLSSALRRPLRPSCATALSSLPSSPLLFPTRRLQSSSASAVVPSPANTSSDDDDEPELPPVPPSFPSTMMHVHHAPAFKSTVSSPSHPHNVALSSIVSSEKSALLAGAPGGGRFAVLELGGTQIKVSVGDVGVLDRLQPHNVFTLGAVVVRNEHEHEHEQTRRAEQPTNYFNTGEGSWWRRNTRRGRTRTPHTRRMPRNYVFTLSNARICSSLPPPLPSPSRFSSLLSLSLSPSLPLLPKPFCRRSVPTSF